jgi:hypothetical protein
MLVVWSRNDAPATTTIDLSRRFGADAVIRPVFPSAAQEGWDERSADGVLTIRVGGTEVAARVYRIDRRLG